MGEELRAGDMNGDEIDDLVIGGLGANSVGNGAPAAGEAWVVWGSPDYRMVTGVDLRAPPAGLGTLFYGIAADDLAGDTTVIGDFNGDSWGDLAIGSPQHDEAPSGEPGRFDSGRVDIFFGGPNAGIWPWPEVVELASPPADLNVVTIYGADPFDLLCYSMGVGDIDDDGFADLLPNAMRGQGATGSISNAGEGYALSGAVLWDRVLEAAGN